MDQVLRSKTSIQNSPKCSVSSLHEHATLAGIIIYSLPNRKYSTSNSLLLPTLFSFPGMLLLLPFLFESEPSSTPQTLLQIPQHFTHSTLHHVSSCFASYFTMHALSLLPVFKHLEGSDCVLYNFLYTLNLKVCAAVLLCKGNFNGHLGTTKNIRLRSCLQIVTTQFRRQSLYPLHIGPAIK